MYFRYFIVISQWKKVGLFIRTNLNPFHPRMLCAKFGCNWLSGSWGDFYISSMYFLYFVIISPWERAGPFIWTNLNRLNPRMLCAKFGWNWFSGSGEEDENVKSLRQWWITDKFWSEKHTWAFGSGELIKMAKTIKVVRTLKPSFSLNNKICSSNVNTIMECDQ